MHTPQLIVITFALLFNVVASASSANCEEFDLSEDPRFPPIRNQEGSHWCTAFALADLLSFAEGRTISPVDIAVKTYATFHRREDKKELNLGLQPMFAMMTVQKFGTCREERLPVTEIQELNISTLGSTLSYVANQNDPVKRAKLASRISPKTCRPSLVEGPDAFENVVRFVDQACAPRRPLRTSFKTEINDSVQPLRESSSRGWPSLVVMNMKTAFGIDTAETPMHSMVVVGKKWNAELGQCRYIVRNSWGSECKDFPTSKNTSCRDGFLEVEESHLHKNTPKSFQLERIPSGNPAIANPTRAISRLPSYEAER